MLTILDEDMILQHKNMNENSNDNNNKNIDKSNNKNGKIKLTLDISCCNSYDLSLLLNIINKYETLKVIINGNYSINPNKLLTSKKVVELQMYALKDNNIKHCFKYASERNQSFTGPLQRFTSMIRGHYSMMIDWDTIKIELNKKLSNIAKYSVIIVKNNKSYQFSWILSKQKDTDMWMTDGVG